MKEPLDKLTVLLALAIMAFHSLGYITFESGVILLLTGIWTTLEIEL